MARSVELDRGHCGLQRRLHGPFHPVAATGGHDSDLPDACRPLVLLQSLAGPGPDCIARANAVHKRALAAQQQEMAGFNVSEHHRVRSCAPQLSASTQPYSCDPTLTTTPTLI